MSMSPWGIKACTKISPPMMDTVLAALVDGPKRFYYSRPLNHCRKSDADIDEPCCEGPIVRYSFQVRLVNLKFGCRLDLSVGNVEGF